MEGGKTTNAVVDLALRFAIAIGGAILSLGFVAFVGGIVLWSRFDAAQLPADQAVALQPRSDLVTVGAIALVFFVLGGLVAVLLLRALDQHGNPTFHTRNGLIAVAALEIAAALIVERPAGEEVVKLVVATVAGLFGVIVLLNAGGWWYENHQPYYDVSIGPTRKLLRRAREAFFTAKEPVVRPPFVDAHGRPVRKASRLRLWLAVLLMGALVTLVASGPELVSGRLDGYAPALIPLVAGLAIPGFSGRGPTRTWSLLVVALGVLVAAAIVYARESAWVGWVALLALALIVVNLMAAEVTQRFPGYGIALFLSVILFGVGFQLMRAHEDPQAQAVAFVRENDAQPVYGLYVGETDSRLYYARLDLEGDRDVSDDSGRLLWAPRERVVAWAVGPLEPVAAAQETAFDLRAEVDALEEPSSR